jgi:4-carboxymuconolactone decarboxylase
MSIDSSSLGGRPPLYDREALNPGQRELHDWLMNAAVPWAERAKFQARTETGRLMGPFNPALISRKTRWLPTVSPAHCRSGTVSTTRFTAMRKRCWGRKG